MTGEEVVARARALTGTPFRLHGRDDRGMDCVGLAAAALDVSPAAVPGGYRLRGGTPAQVGAAMAAAGLEAVATAAAPGDLMLCRTGPGQLHLAIRSEAGIIHADAALNRVTERPGPPPWPVIGCWRRRAAAPDRKLENEPWRP